MGRDSGFIAAYAALATTTVNFCPCRKCPSRLEGDHGLFKALETRYSIGKTHAVLVVAEGAGQDLSKAPRSAETRAATFLRMKSANSCSRRSKTTLTKSARKSTSSISTRATPCAAFRQGNGRDFLLPVSKTYYMRRWPGNEHGRRQHARQFTHVPIEYAVSERRKIEPDGALWHAVLGATRQDDYFSGRASNRKISSRNGPFID